MPRFWLAYNQCGRLSGVVILESSSFDEARMRAALDRIDGGAAFAKGYRLDKGVGDLVPLWAIGHMLDPIEACDLIRRLAARAQKRRPLVKLG